MSPFSLEIYFSLKFVTTCVSLSHTRTHTTAHFQTWCDIYVGKQIPQHSMQISRQSEDSQQASMMPQSMSQGQLQSSPRSSAQQQQQQASDVQAPHDAWATTMLHRVRNSQNRQARMQWTQQSEPQTKEIGGKEKQEKKNKQTTKLNPKLQFIFHREQSKIFYTYSNTSFHLHLSNAYQMTYQPQRWVFGRVLKRGGYQLSQRERRNESGKFHFRVD